jgi:hypothetical protein
MKATLEGLGFAVNVKENLRNPSQFIEALDETLKTEKATSDDILFVYYSGHGVQIDGRAYLLGTGVSEKAQVVEDTRANAQSAEALLAEMERALPATRVLMVEACRDAFSSAASRSGDSRVAKGGFAFRQDDVPNTFVMFANKPGLPTPARSEGGLMGPFTESFIYALGASTTGEIQDVYRLAAEKTREMSPGQEPDEHHSRTVDSVLLRPRDAAVQDKRAKALLNDAEPMYRDRAWDDFLAAVTRGKALSTDPELQQRLSHEVDFASLAKAAEESESARKWSDAAAKWQKASEIFPARQWATMRAAIAWLLADDLTRGVRVLAVVAAQSEGDAAVQAKRMLTDLIKSFPALQAEATKAAEAAAKISGVEFEPIKHEE